MEVSESKLLPAIEKALIKFFKPPLNRTHIRIRKPKGGKPGRKGGNPETYFKTDFAGKLAKRVVGTKLPEEIDLYLTSLERPAADWLRQAAIEKYEREMQQKSA